MTVATPQEWYRFLDVVSGEEAADDLRFLITRLEGTRNDLESAARPLSDAPDGEVNEALWIARTALADAIDRLETVGSHFWTSERQSA